MATSVRTPSSTRDKLLRAQSAAARMARLTTGEKNAILLAIADAIAANSASIIEANRADLADSGIAGAMRDRLLLTPERIATVVAGVREVAGPGRVVIGAVRYVGAEQLDLLLAGGRVVPALDQ